MTEHERDTNNAGSDPAQVQPTEAPIAQFASTGRVCPHCNRVHPAGGMDGLSRSRAS